VIAVERLVTVVDVHDVEADAHTMSVSARHEAVLADGRHVVLLDGRGWTSALRYGELRADVPDIWSATSVEEIQKSARTVVGPDEPFDGHTQEELEAAHWDHLAGVLRQQGVIADARELKRLPHDVLLSERLRARVRS
jgi:hypothetical protein